MMKVDMDRIYCCGQEMEVKGVIDLDRKDSKALFICKKCGSNFKIKKPFIANIIEKTPTGGVINFARCLPVFCPFLYEISKHDMISMF